MGKRELSATMAVALGFAIEHGGRLERRVGGYWTYPGCPSRNDGAPAEEWFGTSTIEALVKRGELEYVEWKAGKSYRFPIAAVVAPEKPFPKAGGAL